MRLGESHTVFDFWIVGPSAMGSVKGIPSSITSGFVNLTVQKPWNLLACVPAPPRSIDSIISGVSWAVG